MIESPARVVRTEGEVAWVVPESPASCGACGGKGCGSSIFTRLIHAGKEPAYPAENPIHARPGDVVVVGVEDGAVIRAAVMAYILPLSLLLIGAMTGTLWGEIYSVLGAVVGLALATIWLRRRHAAHPRLVRLGSTVCSRRN